MNRLLPFLLLLGCLNVRGANPAFTDFNPNDFVILNVQPKISINPSFTNTIFATNATFVTLYTSNAFFTNVVVNNLYVSNAFFTNLSVFNTTITSNLFSTNIFATNAYITNLFVNDFHGKTSIITNLFVTNAFFQYITNVNEFTTNFVVENITNNIAYITNLYSSNIFTTNITVFDTLVTSNAYITNLYVTNLTVSYLTNINYLISSNAYITNLFTTNLFATTITNVTLVTSNLFTTNLNVFNTTVTSNLFATNIYVTNLFVGSNAYTPHLFAIDASFTNNAAGQILVFDAASNIVWEIEGDSGGGSLRYTNGGSWSTNSFKYPSNMFVASLTSTNGITNQALIASQYVATDANKALSSTLDGSSWTNLTLKYTTNAIPALTLTFGKAYYTNLAANATLTAFVVPDSAALESLLLFVTNNSGADKTVTGPAGVWGLPGSGSPPVYYCTNNRVTILEAYHYGVALTNFWKLDFAP